MTSSAPPTTQNVTETTIKGRIVYDVELHEEPADRIGQSLSGELVALIAGIRADFTSYGPRHPVRRALTEWERACRSRHRPGPSLQWRDHAAGPLCSDLLRAASIGVSLRWCAVEWDVPYPRAERLLLAGLRFVAERVARAQDDALGIVHDRERCDVCQEEERA